MHKRADVHGKPGFGFADAICLRTFFFAAATSFGGQMNAIVRKQQAVRRKAGHLGTNVDDGNDPGTSHIKTPTLKTVEAFGPGTPRTASSLAERIRAALFPLALLRQIRWRV